MLLLGTSERRQQAPVLAPDSPEALIREARRRTRRRRARWSAALALLVGAAVGTCALLIPAEPGVIAATRSSPYANLTAFSGHGELAFVSRGQLWVLDGGSGTLRQLEVPSGHEAGQPTFSHDGRWLAYLVRPTSTNYYGPFQLWIAHGDGTDARRARGVGLDELVGWSPHTDVLAVTAAPQSKRAPFGYATRLELVSPGHHPRTLVTAPAKPAKRWGIDAVGAAAWSPDGRALAVDLVGALASRIETVPVAGTGAATVWFAAASGPVRIAGLAGRVPSELIPQLAGWWPRWGIAFWVIDEGAVNNRDSTPLAVIRRPGAAPRYLAETLSLGMSEELAPGSNGLLALESSSSNAGREIGAGKVVDTCSPRTARCTAVGAATSWTGPNTQTPVCRHCGLPRPLPAGASGSGVSLDPAWSPDGKRLTFVKAPVAETVGDPDRAWFDDHAIYLWNSATHATRRIGRVDGSAVPTWSADGRDLLYESDDGLWLMPVASAKPVEIVHPLYAETEWNSKVSPLASISYYGQIPWQQQFSWWSPAR